MTYRPRLARADFDSLTVEQVFLIVRRATRVTAMWDRAMNGADQATPQQVERFKEAMDELAAETPRLTVQSEGSGGAVQTGDTRMENAPTEEGN